MGHPINHVPGELPAQLLGDVRVSAGSPAPEAPQRRRNCHGALGAELAAPRHCRGPGGRIDEFPVGVKWKQSAPYFTSGAKQA